ncbi:hypothetical protein F8568_031650 [Actinomadura sp. LD22]|uniref:Zn-ribbon domain-containing OB-fold protein n=1 Tax=Actinomadura physcomitrii TaxID=2650748 RepID=A0A6I4MLJ8_9ACTN|nr:zinc ribbon domain-containing protein [Actinomadura physcomitrii]MWA04847.1 hypothetical protein [Actinomadura physcomitrii]
MSVHYSNQITPDLDNPLILPFWEACQRHELVAQHCPSCDTLRFPPLSICANCWSENQAWTRIEPFATLWSFVIYRRAMNPAFADEIPYAIGRVKTDAGPVFETRLAIPLDEIEIGMPLVASFRDVNADFSLLQFEKR